MRLLSNADSGASRRREPIHLGSDPPVQHQGPGAPLPEGGELRRNSEPDSGWALHHRPGFRITYFNPAAEKITGFLAQDAVGMYCKDVFKNPLCVCDCALKRAVTEDRDVQNREYVITNIDGQKVRSSAPPRPFGCLGPHHRRSGDLQGHHRAASPSGRDRPPREKYRRIFEGSHDMIYTSNCRGGC